MRSYLKRPDTRRNKIFLRTELNVLSSDSSWDHSGSNQVGWILWRKIFGCGFYGQGDHMESSKRQLSTLQPPLPSVSWRLPNRVTDAHIFLDIHVFSYNMYLAAHAIYFFVGASSYTLYNKVSIFQFCLNQGNLYISVLNLVVWFQKMEPTPTADLDRSNDRVYDRTTCVVKAVMALSQGLIIWLLIF